MTLKLSDTMRISRRALARAVCALALIMLTPAASSAQNDGVIRSVYAIGNVDAMANYPIVSYSVDGNALREAYTWRYPMQTGDTIGLAFDPFRGYVYIAYKGLDYIDVIDARNGDAVDQKVLTGMTDVIEIEVHGETGDLYAIDRAGTTVFLFDGDTFAPTANWELTDLDEAGAYDLEIVEDWDGRDLAFVSDTTADLHYYDLDTHEHLGSYFMSGEVYSFAVDQSGADLVIFAVGGQTRASRSHDFLLKYDVAADQITTTLMNDKGNGIAVNPALGLVYVGLEGMISGSMQVFDMATATQQNHYNLPGEPGDLAVGSFRLGNYLQMEITSESDNENNPAGVFEQGEPIVFEITVTNNNPDPLHFLPLTDEYNSDDLSFVSSTAAPSDSSDDGTIGWNDLIQAVGHDLAFEETYTFSVTFSAAASVCDLSVDGVNTIRMTGAEDAQGDPIDEQTVEVNYKIWCGCVADEDCEDGLYCNGAEHCTDHECFHSGNPCPIQDSLFCNGHETDECIEDTQECGHEGDPCAENDMICVEESDSCEAGPADDDADDDVNDDDTADDADADAGSDDNDDDEGGCCG